jgi:glycogen synthase
MRIVLVADTVGGVRTFTRELVRELVRRGIEIHLALIGRGGSFGPGAGVPGAASCHVRDLKLEWMDDPWEDVAATAEWVEELRHSLAPDLLHMNTFAPVLDSDVPVLLTVHSCVLSWWRAVHGEEAPARWSRYRRLVERALARTDRVVVPTRALLDQLEPIYGKLPHAQVIANGRDVGPEGRSSPRSREPLVLSIGRLWDEAKNAALLVGAASRIDGRVALIGAGDGGGEVERLPALPDREVLGWLARAAVFAEPARYEPFGLAALEAALCGCALVLGDIPSLHEVWDDAARYVDPDDYAALATTINALLNDHQRSALQAQRRARRYAPATMARAYRDAYAALTRSALAA